MSDFDVSAWCDRILDKLNTQSATLSFSLPTQDAEFRTAVNGVRFLSVLCDMDNEMRSTLKHDAAPMVTQQDGGELTKKENTENDVIYNTTDYWRDRMWSLLGEQNVGLWDE